MTSKEIEELAGHRQVPAWVVKLVSDAVAAEREAIASILDEYDHKVAPSLMAKAIRARGQE
jgi:hypothetical protein